MKNKSDFGIRLGVIEDDNLGKIIIVRLCTKTDYLSILSKELNREEIFEVAFGPSGEIVIDQSGLPGDQVNPAARLNEKISFMYRQGESEPYFATLSFTDGPYQFYHELWTEQIPVITSDNIYINIEVEMALKMIQANVPKGLFLYRQHLRN